MKAQRIGVAFIALILLAGLSTASPLNPYSEDPMGACEDSPMLWSMFRTLHRAGFSFVEMEEQPILYFAPPTGDYDWGKIMFTWRHSSSEVGIETEYCTITAEIEYYAGRGFTIDRLEYEWEMVY